MAKSIDDAFKKPALDQLKDGADYVGLINFLQRLFGDWENRNTIASLHHIIKRWADKTSKMMQRDDKIKKALNVLDSKVLTNTVKDLADVFLVKKFEDSIPAARASDFFEKLIQRARKMRALNDQQIIKIKRLINRLIRANDNVLGKKLYQWRDTAKKITDETCKRKIARLIENKYKTNKARDQWNKLVEKYDLYVNNRLIYYVRARLRNWLRLKDMMEILRNEFTKVGNKQFKDGAKLKHTLVFKDYLIIGKKEINISSKDIMYRWVVKVQKIKNRDKQLDDAMKVIDKNI